MRSSRLVPYFACAEVRASWEKLQTAGKLNDKRVQQRPVQTYALLLSAKLWSRTPRKAACGTSRCQSCQLSCPSKNIQRAAAAEPVAKAYSNKEMNSAAGRGSAPRSSKVLTELQTQGKSHSPSAPPRAGARQAKQANGPHHSPDARPYAAAFVCTVCSPRAIESPQRGVARFSTRLDPWTQFRLSPRHGGTSRKPPLHSHQFHKPSTHPYLFPALLFPSPMLLAASPSSLRRRQHWGMSLPP